MSLTEAIKGIGLIYSHWQAKIPFSKLNLCFVAEVAHASSLLKEGSGGMGVRRSLSDPASRSGSSEEQPTRQQSKNKEALTSGETREDSRSSSGGNKLWTKEEPQLNQQQLVPAPPAKEEKVSCSCLCPECAAR